MIIIKTLLFKLLDEVEPNELLEIHFRNSYSTVFLANKKSILPLAISMHRVETDSIADIYREVFQNRETAYERNFIESHTVEINNIKYVIDEELLDIEFEEAHFSVTVATPTSIYTSYYRYDDITVIKRLHEKEDNTVQQYNSMNAKFKDNKNI